jgi:hypothetical protein
MGLELQPITLKEAKAFVNEHHSHNVASIGHKFSIAVNDGEKVVGVVMVGRPVARHFDDGWTAEVTRCCTDGTKNVASMLYAAAWRCARAMGYKRVITYTLLGEEGVCLKAAGWKIVGQTKGQGTWESRPRTVKWEEGPKMLWQA